VECSLFFVGAGAALGIVGHLRRSLAHFKLGTHFSDLGGLLHELGCEGLCLLSELDCESLYLFLLLSDCCFQLLNFANFAIEHGGPLCSSAGRATALRCATLHRSAATLARAKIPAKVVVSTVQSNYNNAATNRLEVVEDTTDVAL
jgi:hypothetical protein